MSSPWLRGCVVVGVLGEEAAIAFVGEEASHPSAHLLFGALLLGALLSHAGFLSVGRLGISASRSAGIWSRGIRVRQSVKIAWTAAMHTSVRSRARHVFAAPERRPGRPPQRGLLEKLHILADVEAAYESGGTLADVADRHHMSRAAVRDLLSWARKDATPQLFEGITPGRKGGGLTPAARDLLSRMRQD